MARSRAKPPETPPDNGTASTGAEPVTQPALPAPAKESESPPEKRPLYKVGPILTDRHSAVVACVWAYEHPLGNGQSVTVHTVTVEARWYDAAHVNADGSKGTWKVASSFRGGQLYAVIYCLQKASDFILAERDPQNDCPF